MEKEIMSIYIYKTFDEWNADGQSSGYEDYSEKKNSIKKS